MKDERKNIKCSVELVPDPVSSGLLEQATRIRIGKDADKNKQMTFGDDVISTSE